MKDRFEKFSENLRNERKARGLTQLEIASALGISQPVYSRYEKGGTPQGREPDFETLCKISKLLEAGTDFLLGLED